MASNACQITKHAKEFLWVITCLSYCYFTWVHKCVKYRFLKKYNVSKEILFTPILRDFPIVAISSACQITKHTKELFWVITCLCYCYFTWVHKCVKYRFLKKYNVSKEILFTPILRDFPIVTISSACQITKHTWKHCFCITHVMFITLFFFPGFIEKTEDKKNVLIFILLK